MPNEFNLEAIKDIGDFNITPCDSIDLSNSRFMKIDQNSSQKAHVNFLLSQLPTIMAADTLSQAYVVEFPFGLPHTLTALKDGGYMNMIRGSDGRFAGVAPLHPLSAEAAFLGVFSTMSIVTGQYFLTKINNEFKMLNRKMDDIIDFLYGDKKAELMSEISFVQYAHQNYASIMAHETQRIATITSLQEAKKIAMKDMEFYINDLESKADSSQVPYAEFQSLSHDVFQIRTSLELSKQLYVMSGLLELYYAQNNDHDYIDMLKTTMVNYIDNCDKRMLSNFSMLKGQLKEFKSTPLKKIDTTELKHAYDKVIDLLSDSEKSQMHKTIDTSFATANRPNKYYLTKDGDIYMRTSTTD